MAAIATKHYTVEEWMDLPEDQTRRTELVDGEIILMGNANFRHEKLKSVWMERLFAHLLANPNGRVYSETMYRLSPQTARVPDVSVLLPDRPAVDSACEGAPEIAIEVISSESAAEIDRRIQDYLSAGCQLVVITYLDRRLWCYTPDGTARLLTVNQHFETPLLPGLRIPVADLFQAAE